MNTHDSKIKALVEKMNLDQLVGQIVQPERQFITPEEVKQYHIGSVLSGGGSTPGDNTPADWVDMNDAYWAASMEADEDHLPIPIIYGVDAIHGNSNVTGAVVFPHNIGLGAARDPELMTRIAQATAREITATGVEWTFAPTLAVGRNSHWGRTFESYSEDPRIAAELAPAFVKGLQGQYSEENVVACIKHWIGDGGTTHGIDQGDTAIDEDELRRIHLPPYIAAIEAGALTVMVSLSSWNGEKCHAHRYLLTDLLKKELNFQGFVISDWDGIDYLDDDYSEAAALGINAGMDMFMVTEKWREFIDHIKTHVQSGRVSMDRLRDAVTRILRVKFEYGLFDKPRPAERALAKDPSSFGSREHREIAREAVRKSMVLLKNEEQVLPLRKNARILVAGKNAHNRGHQCGGFTVEWQGVTDNDSIVGGTSIWEGIKAMAPNAVLSGAEYGEDADPERHEAAIVVIGETPYAEMLGDVRVEGLKPVVINTYESDPEEAEEDLYAHHLYLHEMHPEDLRTIETIRDRGVPVVVVMVCGRPLVTSKELEASKAFAVAWLPGSEGQGVADVLFGDFDFQGRLSFSWPRYDDDNWNVGDEGYNPLFPYGYGLSYSKTARED